MYSRLFVILSAIFICSCATPKKAIIPENTKPVSLSSAQTAVIKRDLIKSLKDVVSGIFGPMSASSDGTLIYVCGWVSGKTSFGNYTGATTYFGTLSESQGKPVSFSPLIFGIDGYKQLENMDMCTKFRIHITFPLE